ncbi:MAG: hypothetical protein SGPRY_006127, partial [Prymnesium sp.]
MFRRLQRGGPPNLVGRACEPFGRMGWQRASSAARHGCGIALLLALLAIVPFLALLIVSEFLDLSSPLPATGSPAAPPAVPSGQPEGSRHPTEWRFILAIGVLVAVEATACLMAIGISELLPRIKRQLVRTMQAQPACRKKGLKFGAIEPSNTRKTISKDTADALHPAATEISSADEKPLKLSGKNDDKVVKHLEGALATLEAIIFEKKPKLPPRAVVTDSHTPVQPPPKAMRQVEFTHDDE